MHIYALIINYFLLYYSSDASYEPIKYCREKQRLIGLEVLDEFLLVEAVINSTIILECRFCEDKVQTAEPKVWYWQNRYQNETEREVELGMDSDVSLNRIYTTPDMSLGIKKVHFNDTGYYRCHGVNGEEASNKYNYNIETVFQRPSIVDIQRGNLSEWEKYRETYLIPVTLRFSVSRMDEFVQLRENGISLEVISEWGPWSPCENCINNYGMRTSETLCRIKRTINETNHPNNSILEYFRIFPIIPCRSFALAAKFPSVSRAVRFLPSFILEEKCHDCRRVRKIKKFAFKYKKRYILREGSHLIISCPESKTESKVLWKKNDVTLTKGATKSRKKSDTKSKTIVDVFSTLYLIEVTSEEQGNYTCYVDGQKMMTLKVVVISYSKLLTTEFLRHSKYLGFILLLTTFCYCAGLIQSYRQKNDMEESSYTKIDENDDEYSEGTDINE